MSFERCVLSVDTCHACKSTKMSRSVGCTGWAAQTLGTGISAGTVQVLDTHEVCVTCAVLVPIMSGHTKRSKMANSCTCWNAASDGRPATARPLEDHVCAARF